MVLRIEVRIGLILRLVLTMKNGRVSPIGDNWIDMCPLYEVNVDQKISFKKT